MLLLFFCSPLSNLLLPIANALSISVSGEEGVNAGSCPTLPKLAKERNAGSRP